MRSCFKHRPATWPAWPSLAGMARKATKTNCRPNQALDVSRLRGWLSRLPCGGALCPETATMERAVMREKKSSNDHSTNKNKTKLAGCSLPFFRNQAMSVNANRRRGPLVRLRCGALPACRTGRDSDHPSSSFDAAFQNDAEKEKEKCQRARLDGVMTIGKVPMPWWSWLWSINLFGGPASTHPSYLSSPHHSSPAVVPPQSPAILARLLLGAACELQGSFAVNAHARFGASDGQNEKHHSSGPPAPPFACCRTSP